MLAIKYEQPHMNYERRAHCDAILIAASHLNGLDV